MKSLLNHISPVSGLRIEGLPPLSEEGNIYLNTSEGIIDSNILKHIDIDIEYLKQKTKDLAFDLHRLEVEEVLPLQHKKIWRGNSEGIREQSNDLSLAEETITQIRDDLTSLREKLNEEDIVITTASDLFPNAQVLKNISQGLMFLDDVGKISTRETIELSQLPFLLPNYIYIGDYLGGVSRKEISSLIKLPELEKDRIWIGKDDNSAESVDVGTLPFGEGFLLNAKKSMGASSMQRSHAEISADGALTVSSIVLTTDAGRSISHAVNPLIIRNTAYSWPSAEQGKFLKAVNNDGALEWADVRLEEQDLRSNYILEGNNLNKAQAKLPSTFEHARTNNSKIVVTEQGAGFRLLDLSFPNAYGNIGQTLKLIDFNRLDWADFPEDTKNMPLVLNSYYPDHNNAQILSELGSGIAKVELGGKIAIAREGFDYTGVEEFQRLKGDVEEAKVDIQQNKIQIRENSISITRINGEVVALQGEVTGLAATVSSFEATLIGLVVTSAALSATVIGIGIDLGTKASYDWVEDYVDSHQAVYSGSSSINIDDRTISVNEGWLIPVIDNQIAHKYIPFLPKNTDPDTLIVGENVVILSN